MTAEVRPIVVKIGGSTLGSHDTTLDDVAALHAEGRRVVVVHGGGAVISEWLAKQGIEARFERGLRVTDETSLEVVVAVLAGLVNKQLVATLAANAPAVGLSGADGGLLRGSVRDPALGRVGEIDAVDPAIVNELLQAGRLPVIAPVAAEYTNGRPTGALLNVNADTVAGHIAGALRAAELIFLTDVPGIKDGDGRVLSTIGAREAAGLIENGVISGGMIPKAQAAILASGGGAATRIVDGREPNALRRALAEPAYGSTIG